MQGASAILLRLAQPLAALYLVWLGSHSDVAGFAVAAGLMTLLFLVMILRGLTEDMGGAEAGLATLTLAALFLASLPALSRAYTPGICTDSSPVYEIALLGAMYGGMTALSHALSKLLMPARTLGVTQDRARQLNRLSRTAVLGAAMLLVLPAGWLFRQGACAPDAQALFLVPMLSLLPLGLLIFFSGAALRLRKALATRNSAPGRA